MIDLKARLESFVGKIALIQFNDNYRDGFSYYGLLDGFFCKVFHVSSKWDLYQTLHLITSCISSWNISSSGAIVCGKILKQEVDQIISKRTSRYPALIMASSGSTGKPKIIVHDLAKLIEPMIKDKPSKMRMVTTLKPDHIGGINALFNTIINGGTFIISEDSSVEKILSDIEKGEANVLSTTPSFLRLLFSTDHLLPDSLRLITYGTEKMESDLLVNLKSRFPRIRFQQTFGTTETGILPVKFNEGTWIDLNENYKIEEGKLFIRSNTMMESCDGEDISSDDWYWTGDIVVLSEDFKSFRIIGRESDIINIGGNKVNPQYVEEMINKLDVVEDCLVKPLKNTIVGEAVQVVVELKEGFNISKMEILKHCHQNLKDYEVPVKITFSKVQYTERGKKNRRAND